MKASPTRIVAITATATNIAKTPGFANDPDALPVTYRKLYYASGGATMQLVDSPFQTGTLTFVTNPLDTETIAINGVTYTFKTTPTTAVQVQIGATKEITAANLVATLTQSVNASITVAAYAVALTGGQPNANIITITYKTPGTTSYTLANSSGTVAVTRSGAALTGGGAYGTGEEIPAGAEYTDISQSLNRYVVASGAGPTNLFVTDYRA